MNAHSAAVESYVLPPEDHIERARTKLIENLPKEGIGLEKIQNHVHNDLVPAFNKPSKSPNYYGFVIGGATPAAEFADHVAIEYDQNLAVHLPKETIATDVEDRALRMVCELADLDPEAWAHRTFSSGGTASNILGLACGREYVLQQAGKTSIAEHGISKAMQMAGIDEIQVLVASPHSSVRKAASVVGLGRASVKEVGKHDSPHQFDMQALEAALAQPRTASIVALSCGEVNTGFFATSGNDMQQIRRLCDKHGAWIHTDGAVGLLARVLPNTAEFRTIVEGVKDLELADSIAGDAHKLLNVPYDCGIFLSRHLIHGIDVFKNTNAAYIDVPKPGSGERVIPVPLNIGLENSRRFRALPVYTTLTTYGRDGYRDMMERQVRLARGIADFIINSPDYELLPEGNTLESVYVIVIFRAVNEKINAELVQRINTTRKIYVSGTSWDNKPAVRFAIATWMVDVDRDLARIKEVLGEAAK